MKKILLPTLTALAMVFALATTTSCIGDNDSDSNYIYYDDVAITSISMGTLNRSVTTKTKDGKSDSTYIAKITGSSYKFSIDQEKGEVWNMDSLPTNTDASKVVLSVSAKNGGTVVVKKLDSEDFDYLRSTDSLDFTQPRIIRVYSNSRQYSKDYVVRVNVHREEADSFRWNAPVDEPSLLAMAHPKAVAVAGEVKFVDSETPVTVWKGSVCSYTAAGVSRVYSLQDGAMKSSLDAASWEEDKVLAGTVFPASVSGCVCIPSATNADVCKIVVIGSGSDGKAVIATRVEDGLSNGDAWFGITFAKSNPKYLPSLEGMSVVCYDDAILAVGRRDGQLRIYCSKDQGLTWEQNASYPAPDGFPAEGELTAAADGQGFLWIACGGKVWKGRLNRLGWETSQKVFVK